MSEKKNASKDAGFRDALARFRSEKDTGWRTAPDAVAKTQIKRALIDVEVDGRLEWVELRVEGQEIVARSSAPEGEQCIHAVLEALQLPGHAASEGRTSVLPPAPNARTESDRSETTPDPGETIANALDDLRTAIVRAGLRKGLTAPGFVDAYERLIEVLETPIPWGADRWLKALREAIGAKDSESLARLFVGSERVSQAYREQDRDRLRFLACVGWNARGASQETERMSDRKAVELARRWDRDLAGNPQELRYLLCLNTGEVFREVGLGTAQNLSDGPCPRSIRIGLADTYNAPGSRWIQLLQYTVGSEWSLDTRRRIRNRAESKWLVLLDRYRRLLDEAPGLFEVPVLLSPTRLVQEKGECLLVDGDGDILPVADPVISESLLHWTAGATPTWVFGTLAHKGGALTLQALSAFEDNEELGRGLLLA